MPSRAVEFTFERGVLMDEAADTLKLARLAVESLLGPDRVRLEVQTAVDPVRQRVAIATGTRSGRALAAVFLGLVRREFGENAFRTQRCQSLRGAEDQP